MASRFSERSEEKRERWVVVGDMRTMIGNRVATIIFCRYRRPCHWNLEKRGKL